MLIWSPMYRQARDVWAPAPGTFSPLLSLPAVETVVVSEACFFAETQRTTEHEPGCLEDGCDVPRGLGLLHYLVFCQLVLTID